MKTINPRQTYDALMASMPAGLDRGIWSIMRFHIGPEEAAEKEPLMLALEKIGFHLADERQLRAGIVRLRKAGYPICSSSTNGGYFLPANLSQFIEFVSREYWKKIKDMIETAKAMMDFIANVFPVDYLQWKKTRTFSKNPETLEIEGVDEIPIELPVIPVEVKQASLF